MILRGWEPRLLSDVAGVTVGHVGPMTHEYVPEGVPFLRSQDVSPLRVRTDRLKYISESFHQRLAKSALTPGDVVIVRTGRPGAAAVIPADLPVANCADLVIIRPGPEVDSRFLAYYINSAPKGHIAAHLVGAVQQHFNVTSAKALHIALPPLDEQVRIVSVLGAFDDKIDSNRRLAGRLGDLALVVFRHSFGGHVEGTDRLGDHVTVTRGRSYKSSELVESDRALVTLKSIRPGGGYNPDGLKPYAGDFKPEQLVRPGELVVAHTDLTQSAAVVGKPAIVPDAGGFAELIVSLDLAVVRPATDRVSVPFLYHLFLEPAFQQHAYGLANGSTVLHLNKEAIPSFSFALPEPPTLAAYDGVTQPLLDDANALMTELHTLAATRDTLLPKLISGATRVPDNGDSENATGFLAGEVIT